MLLWSLVLIIFITENDLYVVAVDDGRVKHKYDHSIKQVNRLPATLQFQNPNKMIFFPLFLLASDAFEYLGWIFFSSVMENNTTKKIYLTLPQCCEIFFTAAVHANIVRWDQDLYLSRIKPLLVQKLSTKPIGHC